MYLGDLETAFYPSIVEAGNLCGVEIAFSPSEPKARPIDYWEYQLRGEKRNRTEGYVFGTLEITRWSDGKPRSAEESVKVNWPLNEASCKNLKDATARLVARVEENSVIPTNS